MTGTTEFQQRSTSPARRTFAGIARKTALCGSTAIALTMTATGAYAQCSASGGSNPNFPDRNPTVPVGSTIGGIQSLVGVLSTQNTAFLTQSSSFVGAPGNPPAYTNGGGVWVRGVGGTFNTATPGNFAVGPSAIFDAQSGSCDSVKVFQNYTGFQTGADISTLNIDGYNIHTGVTMGYTESKVRTNQSFSADFQTPFVGFYGAVTKGNFFADAQMRWDFFQGNLNDPSNTLTSQRLNARSWSINGNVGYQVPLDDGWFVEPSAGAVYSKVSVDPLKIGGDFLLQNSASFSAPLTVKIRDFESILGRASVRFGKNFVSGAYGFQPFITASVISEFGDPVRTMIGTNFAALGNEIGFNLSALDSVGVINTYRIKTYGQFSGGLAMQLLNTGWVGYARGDYRIGDRVEGYGLSAGLRYHFNPEAPATPLITKGDAPLLPVIDGPVNWTGISAGASVGGIWGKTTQDQASYTFDVIERVKPQVAGVYVGGQVGADYQFGNFVVGVAGDAGYSNARGGKNCSTSFGGNLYNCQSNLDSLYMATGRIGYAVARTLFYAKGGAAFGDTTQFQQNNFNNQPTFLDFPFGNSGVKAFSTGWAIGGGFEYALTKNWSAKAEYMHYDLGTERYTPVNLASSSNSAFYRSKFDGDIVKIGVNYRFDYFAPLSAPAVIAKN